jgi:DNA primase
VNYRGRHIDPISFWAKYVDFPTNLKIRDDDQFLPKVVCPNPAHDTLKSHFQINVHQPTVHCFAYCGISGDYEHAVCVIEGLYEKFKVDDASDKRERDRRTAKARRYARKLILGQAKGFAGGDEIKRAAKKGSPKATQAGIPDIASAFESYLPPVATEYLSARGISGDSVSKWGIGWDAETKRIVIPVLDEDRHLRFLVKRGLTVKQQPRYLYWPEKEVTGWGKTDVLFGAGQIDLGLVRSSGLVLVEGSIGAILNHQHGLLNTTAILGTGISDKQVRVIAKIKPPRIYFMFDKDTAGIRNIEIATRKLRKYPCFVVKFPKGVDDWDKATRREKERQISRAVPAFRFLNALGLSDYQKGKVKVG